MLRSIYYCCDGPPHGGGQHVNVAHVVALRKMGLRAYLLYLPKSNQIERFKSEAPVVLITAHTMFCSNDVVVVPEGWPHVIQSISTLPCKKIVHCQNPYYLFYGFDGINAIEALDFREMLSCSGYTTEMIRSFGYGLPIHTVRPAVSSVFHSSGEEKIMQIAYMSRKRRDETIFVKRLFRSLYPEYINIDWVEVKDMTHEECASVLRKSQVFASFSFLEGLGLPPLEAMASGCVVAGFDGQGGADYSNSNNGFWAPEGDYFAFAHQLARAIEASQTQPSKLELRRCCALTLQNYSQNSFMEALARAWQLILGQERDDFLLVSS